MYVYLSIFFITIIASFFDHTRFKNLIFYLISSSLICMSTLRGNSFGKGDYEHYIWIYNQIDNWQEIIQPTMHTEFGFRILSYLGNLNGFKAQYIIVMMAILGILPMLYVINNYLERKNLALLIWLPYFFTMNLHSSRISVAAAFGSLFILFYIKKKYIISIFYLLMASLFHTSALILILIFLSKCSVRTLIFFLLFIITLVLLINPIEILIHLSTLLGMDNHYFIRYTEQDYGYAMKIYDPRIMWSLSLIALIYSIHGNLLKEEIFWYKIYIIGAIIILLFLNSTVMAWRLSYYFWVSSSFFIIGFILKYYNLKFSYFVGFKYFLFIFIISFYIIYISWLIYNAEEYKLFEEFAQ